MMALRVPSLKVDKISFVTIIKSDEEVGRAIARWQSDGKRSGVSMAIHQRMIILVVTGEENSEAVYS